MKARCIAVGAVAALPLLVNADFAQATTRYANTPSELQTAINNSVAGDEVVVRTNKILNNASINVNKSSITVRAETVGTAKFTGTTAITITGSNIVFKDFFFDQVQKTNSNPSVYLKGASYCTVVNNYFYKNGGQMRPFAHIVRMENASHHNNIRFNTFEGSISMSVGVILTSSNSANTDNTIEYNHFRKIRSVQEEHPGLETSDTSDPPGTLETNGMECIQLSQGGSGTLGSNTRVEHNLFDEIVGDGSEIISNKCSDNLILHNTFRNCPSQVTLREGNNVKVAANFFFNCNNGIRVYGTNHRIVNNYIENTTGGSILLPQGSSSHVAASNVTLVNNTIINPGGRAIQVGSTSGTQPSNISLINNLVVTGTGHALLLYGTISQFTVSQNLVHLLPGGTLGTINGSALGSSSLSGGFLLANPNLATPTQAYNPYRLTTSSTAAINAGNNGYSVTEDMDGQVRVGNPDIGADELSDDEIVDRPLYSALVGASFAR